VAILIWVKYKRRTTQNVLRGVQGGGFSKEPPGRRRQHAAAPYSRSWDFLSLDTSSQT
jgi:hypothetical protein